MNLYEKLTKTLTGHQGYFAPSLENSIVFNRFEIIKTNFQLCFGLALFIKKEFIVNSSGDFFVFGKKFTYNPNNPNTLPRNA